MADSPEHITSGDVFTTSEPKDTKDTSTDTDIKLINNNNNNNEEDKHIEDSSATVGSNRPLSVNWESEPITPVHTVHAKPKMPTRASPRNSQPKRSNMP